MAPLPFPIAEVRFADFARPPAPPLDLMETLPHIHTVAVFTSTADHYEMPAPRGGPDLVTSFGIAPLSMRMPLPLFAGLESGGDVPTGRMFVLAAFSGQSGVIGDAPAPGDGADQTTFHFFTLLHELRAEAHLAVLSLDALRPAPLSPGDSGSEPGVQRHSSAGPVLGIQGRQSAESGSFDFGDPSAVGQESVFVDGITSPSDGGPEEQGNAAVSHLVAFNDAAVGSASGSAPASLHSIDKVATALHGLLTPRIACDAASLGVALTDLLSEADELGVGLLSVLGDTDAVRGAALVGGLVGAGLAYRQWRGGREREAAEKREMLSARFITRSPALRLDRGSSA